MIATILGSCSKFDSLVRSNAAAERTLSPPARSVGLAPRRRHPTSVLPLLPRREESVSFRPSTADWGPPDGIAISLPLFGLRREPSNLTSGVIPVQCPFLDDDLACSAISPLDVVQVNFSHRSVFKA